MRLLITLRELATTRDTSNRPAVNNSPRGIAGGHYNEINLVRRHKRVDRQRYEFFARVDRDVAVDTLITAKCGLAREWDRIVYSGIHLCGTWLLSEMVTTLFRHADGIQMP